MRDLHCLKAVTHRLNNTPVVELPRTVYFLSSSINSCSDLLKKTQGYSKARNDEVSLQVHKLKTRLASLLRDKTAEGRFVAIVLIKATAEASGWDFLRDCDPFVRGLLAILSRQDPSSSKKLCLVTITRIFSLTREYPTLVREITTPLLPSFITACLKLAGLSNSDGQEVSSFRPNPYLETVLQVILCLLPHHPSTFRPFVSKLEFSLTRLIGGLSCPDQISQQAALVFVSLHLCAPGSTAGTEWLNINNAILESTHLVADQIYRAVIEGWEAGQGGRQQPSNRPNFAQSPHSAENDPLHFPSWQGVYQGSRVMMRLLHFLRVLLQGKTSQDVEVPLGRILSLTSRLLCLRVPQDNKSGRESVRFNPEVDRDEREELFAVLPEIHASALTLLSSIISTLGTNILASAQPILDQCAETFQSESSDEGVRLASYTLVQKVVHLTGSSMSKETFKWLTPIFESCCDDCEPKPPNQNTSTTQSGPKMNGNADSFLQTSKKPISTPSEPTLISKFASNLLKSTLQNIPAKSIPHSLRSRIDRIAILTGQNETMLASVLNPPAISRGKHVTPSILPFLAREARGEIVVEGLLRPRVPSIRSGDHDEGLEEEEEEEEDDGEEEEGNDSEDEVEDVQDLKDGRIDAEKPKPEERIDRSPKPLQNDLLDRLEHSIETAEASHKTVPGKSTAEPSNIPALDTTSHDDKQNPAEDLSERPESATLTPGTKRSSLIAKLWEDAESVKRPRDEDPTVMESIMALDSEKEAGMEPASAIVEADVNVVSMGDIDFSQTGKAKGKQKEIGDTLLEPGATGSSRNKDLDDSDDDSDFEMPPLYLKTSSEEDDDDDEGDRDDDEADLP